MTSNFFSPLSFVAAFGSGILDPGWVKIRIRDLGSGINIPDPQHWLEDVTQEVLPGFALPSRPPSAS
jgi:hypothetical protein